MKGGIQMKKYTVTLLGSVFTVEAENDYQARRLAAIEYRKVDTTHKISVLRMMGSVKVSEEFDGRIRYAPTSEMGK